MWPEMPTSGFLLGVFFTFFSDCRSAAFIFIFDGDNLARVVILTGYESPLVVVLCRDRYT